MADRGEVVGLQEPCFVRCFLHEILKSSGRAFPNLHERLPSRWCHNIIACFDDNVFVTLSNHREDGDGERDGDGGEGVNVLGYANCTLQKSKKIVG